jgi:methyl-accepting chemotaxis protein
MINASLLAAQVASSPPDTLFLAAPSEFLVTVQSVATIVLALVVLGVLGVLLAVLLQVRRLSRSLTDVAKRLERDAGPVVDRAKSVAENVDFISAAVRTDVESLNDTVSRLNARLAQASQRMEERIQDFNALVDVIQSEAEELALDTAAAVRGVRVGTKTLTEGNGNGAEVEEEEAG